MVNILLLQINFWFTVFKAENKPFELCQKSPNLTDFLLDPHHTLIYNIALTESNYFPK